MQIHYFRGHNQILTNIKALRHHFQILQFKLKCSFLQTFIIFPKFRHVIERILPWNSSKSQIVVLSLNPNLPHLHIRQSLICESQIKFIHLRRHASRLCSVHVPGYAHHQRVENDIKVLKLWQISFLNQIVVCNVDGSCK